MSCAASSTQVSDFTLGNQQGFSGRMSIRSHTASADASKTARRR
jgi:hypothetical protein